MGGLVFENRCQNARSGASCWGIGGDILEPFLKSGRVQAVKSISGGVFGGPWAILSAKIAPTWGPRWLQVAAKTMEKSMPKSGIFSMPLRMDFWESYDDFCKENGSNLGAKIDQKSLWFAESGFLKNHRFSSRKTNIFQVHGAEVGRQNQSKIDQNWKSNTSNFDRF